MDRRSFLKKASVTSVIGLSAVSTGCLSDGTAEVDAPDEKDGEESGNTVSGGAISKLPFYSPASQVPRNGVSVSNIAVVRAEETAKSIDTTDSEPYMYEKGDEPPLVSEDGQVVGFGSTELVSDSNGGFEYGCEEFLLNIWDAKLSGKTVIWDEGHDQHWTLGKYTVFHEYAEDEGYEVRATRSLASNISDADGVVITSPSSSFTEEELDALSDFVEEDGAVFLFDQSDFRGHDETENLNRIAEALDLSFRFNSDQINDATNNTGAEFIPLTSNFDGSSEYFARRDTSVEPEGADVEQGGEYTVEVVGVEDGDTADVVFDDGTVETVRFLGLDTPEVEGVDERVAEWSGIDDGEHLRDWGERAGTFAEERLADETVTLVFDEEEPVRGNYGRLLAYVSYDSGDGSSDTVYNLEAVKEGYARAYSSGFSRHDTYSEAENEAFEEGRGLWEAADLDALEEFRNSSVKEMLFPHAVGVEGDVVVRAESTASPSGAPLVAMDEEIGVGAIGAPIMSEDYEKEEGFGLDTSSYDNYTFVTNLAYDLSEREGDAFFEGGHGQFNAEGSLASEDAAYYGRHLEGFGKRLRQVNDLPETLSEVNAATVFVSPPASEYTEDEVSALRDFVESGGSVILIGDARSDNLERLNRIADELGADVGFRDESVTDTTKNVTGSEIIATSNFETDSGFFESY